MGTDEARAPTPGQIAGRTLVELRTEHGWTQEEAARAIRKAGLPWNPANIAAIETGRREDLTVTEVVLLSLAFGVPPTRWFEAQGAVRLGSRLSMRAGEFRDLLAGKVLDGREVTAVIGADALDEVERGDVRPGDAFRLVPSAAESHAGRKLGVDGLRVYELACELWGHGLDEQRDLLLSERDMPSGSKTTYRGHVTRRLIDELRKALDDRSEKGGTQ